MPAFWEGGSARQGVGLPTHPAEQWHTTSCHWCWWGLTAVSPTCVSCLAWPPGINCCIRLWETSSHSSKWICVRVQNPPGKQKVCLNSCCVLQSCGYRAIRTLAGLKPAKVYLHELQSSSDCSIEMSSGRCFYFYYTQFTFGRLFFFAVRKAGNSLKSKHLEDVIQLKYWRQTWSWV